MHDICVAISTTICGAIIGIPDKKKFQLFPIICQKYTDRMQADLLSYVYPGISKVSYEPVLDFKAL